MSYVISFGWVSRSYSSINQSTPSPVSYRDILDVLVVFIGTTIRARQITTLRNDSKTLFGPVSRSQIRAFGKRRGCVNNNCVFTKTIHLLQTRCSDHGNFNKQDLLIVPSIASKNGLFLLVMLLSVTEVSKELRINLFGETGPQTLLPSCNEHVGVEAS